jgi:hypothetical protein
MRKTKVLGRKRSVFHFLFCLLYFEGTNLISNKRPCTRRRKNSNEVATRLVPLVGTIRYKIVSVSGRRLCLWPPAAWVRVLRRKHGNQPA